MASPDGLLGQHHSPQRFPTLMQSSTTPFPCAQAATLADKRIVVAIDGWEADSMYPSGHYVRTLGAIGDRETETEASFCADLLLGQYPA